MIFSSSKSSTAINGITPTVAVMNNGPRKGGQAGTLTLLDQLSNGSAFRLATEAGLAVTGQTTYKATGTITSSSWVQAVVVYNVAAIEDFLLNALRWLISLDGPEEAGVLREFKSALRSADACVYEFEWREPAPDERGVQPLTALPGVVAQHGHDRQRHGGKEDRARGEPGEDDQQ